jgi:hypothetical protein
MSTEALYLAVAGAGASVDFSFAMPLVVNWSSPSPMV